ncbi:hypothetical protein H4S07_005774 [Coemansia furcata]|uniref:Uncharacterized protein n=1 Tax=Coemansia furcata TaxID=417177 RepID=A0ACC1KYZ5_9FUNG|nr:hypothetical protein H4S07_005774 [Coemansia furcata]
MDRSHTTATIGRSQRGMDSMRGLREMLIHPDTHKKEENSSSSSSSSDVEDIDSETAINTVYNLLSELGDLNRSNRRTAEALAEQFSQLQARNSAPISEEEEMAFHTPPTVARVLGDVRISGVQTDVEAAQMVRDGERQGAAEAENAVLRGDVRLLMGALREHQDMAREYEATLARALVALRAAAFERHLEISDVQARYRELLGTEQQLNARLQTENIELRQALSTTAHTLRATLEEQEEES